MFRARFDEAFPKGVPHYGPQDIERGAVESPPGEYIERLLCALLGLVLNRKKDVEYGRHLMPDPARRPPTLGKTCALGRRPPIDPSNNG